MPVGTIFDEPPGRSDSVGVLDVPVGESCTAVDLMRTLVKGVAASVVPTANPDTTANPVIVFFSIFIEDPQKSCQSHRFDEVIYVSLRNYPRYRPL